MCLVVLGDATVARAAAGTAFALVARTRMNPLSEPSRLRSWLLELARGSALAWSGSPQARNVPVSHGVSAEEMIAGAIVPAPTSLRDGLARTFDRAAGTAAQERAAHQAAPQRMPAPQDMPAPRAQPEKQGVPDRPAVLAKPVVTLVKAASATAEPAAATDDGARPAAGPALAATLAAGNDDVTVDVRPMLLPPQPTTGELTGPAGSPSPADGQEAEAGDPPTVAEVVPITVSRQYYADGRGAPLVPVNGAGPRRDRAPDLRTRPTIAVAASLVVAIAGITAALNWPAPASDPAAETFPAIIAASPSTSARAVSKQSLFTAPVPTVAPRPAQTAAASLPRLVADSRKIVPSTTPAVQASTAPPATTPATVKPPASVSPASPPRTSTSSQGSGSSSHHPSTSTSTSGNHPSSTPSATPSLPSTQSSPPEGDAPTPTATVPGSTPPATPTPDPSVSDASTTTIPTPTPTGQVANV